MFEPNTSGVKLKDEGLELSPQKVKTINVTGAGATATQIETEAQIDVPGSSGSGDVTGPASATDGHIAVFDGGTGKVIKDGGVAVSDLATAAQGAKADTAVQSSVLDTDGALAANSDAKVATQKAVKTYVDQIIAAQDAMVFRGVVDCSANPNYPAADRGHTYRVSVAGKIGGVSGANVEAGDLLLCLTDGTASGDQAAVGTAWSIAQSNLDGAVIGPSSVTDSNPAVFDGTSGKLIKQVTYSTFKTSLALVKDDVGLGNVDNTSDATKNSATATLTNKRVTRRVVTVTESATPTINTDNADVASITGLAHDVTSFTTNLSGTPVAGDRLIVEITDDGTARALTWGSSFEASTVALPTTTVISTKLTVGFFWNAATSKWRCVAKA